MSEQTAKPTNILKLAAGSIAVSLVVLGLKYLAYALTGSVALYSDAIESIINVVTAIAAFFAIRISLRPADADHPYGHSKAEYFSTVLEGVLILVASLAILREAYGAILNPHALQAPALGLAVSAVATVLNGAWSWLLITTGRKRRSPALIADGKHLLTDVVTSGGVIVGVLLVALTGWEILDPILAALVALNILWSGWSLIKESVGGLMDTALPTEELAAVQATINANMGGALEAHDLRSRHAGRMTFIDFHLVVEGTMTVDTSHAICDRIEAALKAGHPDSIISIHVEPEAKRKHGAMAIA
ncbi:MULTISPECIES: cation diffusion facilitator family transporter [unclassified Sphingomonas]|uniref:cation diffusion facilitator family transporter n=1 Tax=unclassified Sphingomonas TaxID=196159 RepID=UPI000FF26F42|nr:MULTISPECIES: cation diffusion facilitator family transporter [unclassified Sphingomonas]RKE54236.1 cation diffusion facilitator family transporter [Sphingomonas sp. PP-CC-1A-547]TCM00054.1 cation diffusion facilitator family transporter [Sphingomonas sp. PP-CC-3G-468]